MGLEALDPSPVAILLALSDAHALALTIWGEARGEAVEGRIAVGCVARNRVRDPKRWGTTYTRVCLARQQFSCWNDGDPNHATLLALAAALQRGAPVTDPILRECVWIAAGIISGDVGDRVGPSTHYYATTLSDPPAWAHGATIVARINHHLFLYGVA